MPSRNTGVPVMAGWSWLPQAKRGRWSHSSTWNSTAYRSPYAAPEAAGGGIASRLYDAIETAARAQGIGRLFTEASELARRFFERKGFAVLGRQDMILRGVPIHNYRMAKTLG